MSGMPFARLSASENSTAHFDLISSGLEPTKLLERDERRMAGANRTARVNGLAWAFAGFAMLVPFPATAGEPGASPNPFGVLHPDDFKSDVHPPPEPAVLPEPAPPPAQAPTTMSAPPSTPVPTPPPAPADVMTVPLTTPPTPQFPMTPVPDPGTNLSKMEPTPEGPVVPGATSPTASWTPPAKVNALSAEQIAERRWLSDRAHEALGHGDVIAARAFLDIPVMASDAEALTLLAQTYDPAVLNRWGVVGLAGDPARAKELYDRARDAGATPTTEGH